MKKVAIVVSSFDKYSACWEPFAHGVSKYWSDCPYPIYLITNHKDFQVGQVTALKVGIDQGWASNLQYALEQIDVDYIIYFQEDYWIMERVRQQLIEEYLVLLEKFGLNYVRLLAHPIPDRDSAVHEHLGEIGRNSSYRTSLQIALWRKDVLLELLQPGETAWEFEIEGTERSRSYGQTFLSVKAHGDDLYYHGIRYLCSAINSGRWWRGAKEYAVREGLEVEFSQLPSETWWHEFKRSGQIGKYTGILAHRLSMMIHNPATFTQKLLMRLSK